MSPRPERPRTAAGRLLLADGSATANTTSRRDAILAIEAEAATEAISRMAPKIRRDERQKAAAPYREALRELLTAVEHEGDTHGVLPQTIPVMGKARLLLKGEDR